MINLKASAAVAFLTATALVSAGAGYAVSRATFTGEVAVSCPTPVASAPELPQALPNGPTIPVTKGKGW